jgi:type II secretion system protein H
VGFAGSGVRAAAGGYTILELVLVLAILAIVAVSVAPFLGSFATGRKAEESAARFVALTHWARSQAVSDGTSYELVVDAQGGRWWLRAAGDAEAEIPAGFGRTYRALDDVQMDAELASVDGEQVIRFDPTGRSSVGKVRFSSSRSELWAVCDAPLERFRVVQEEMR